MDSREPARKVVIEVVTGSELSGGGVAELGLGLRRRSRLIFCQGVRWGEGRCLSGEDHACERCELSLVVVRQRFQQRPELGVHLVGEPDRELDSLLGEAHMYRPGTTLFVTRTTEKGSAS
jgi:hypothetical protein